MFLKCFDLHVHRWSLLARSLLVLVWCNTVADLEGGGEPAPPPPPLSTDWRRHSRSCYLMLEFDRSTVKVLRIKNDCHQWFSDSFRVHHFVFGRWSAPEPAGELTALPIPLTGLKGPTSKGEGQGREEKGKEGSRRDRAPLRKFLDPPLEYVRRSDVVERRWRST